MLALDHPRIDTAPDTVAARRDGLGQAEARRLQDLVAMLDRARGRASRPRARLASRGA